MTLRNGIGLSLICSLAFAGVAAANSQHFKVDGGIAFSRLSNNSAVMPASGLVKSYSVKKATQSNVFAGLGVESIRDHVISNAFSLGLGLSVYYVDLGNISGTEVPGSNMGLTDRLDYSMKANSIAMLIEPRLIYTVSRLQPYVLLGVGYAWNTLRDFEESTPSGSNAVPSNAYVNHTESNFAGEVGAGFQYPIFTAQIKGLLAHLEYRYLYLGDARLGAAAGQTTSDRLKSNNISTNIINVGLSYQFQ